MAKIRVIVVSHYLFSTIDGICSLVTQRLDNDSFVYKNYNRIRYLSIRISRTDKIIIFGLQKRIKEVFYWGYDSENLRRLFQIIKSNLGWWYKLLRHIFKPFCVLMIYFMITIIHFAIRKFELGKYCIFHLTGEIPKGRRLWIYIFLIIEY